MYTVWIKIDETLPWIELKGTYETRREAREAAKNCLFKAQIKIAAIPENKKQLNALATIR